MVIAGPAKDRFTCVNKPLRDGDQLKVCGHSFSVMEVPGHTLNHIAYFAQPPGQQPLLFCGDTLFAGGCGRLFEGTPEQMHHSLTRLAALPPDTQIYCAHEYTAANLKFALSLEPENEALRERAKHTQEIRARGEPTIPATLSEELQTNPFLRTDSEQIREAARANNPKLSDKATDIFAQIRSMKDHF